MWGLPLINEFSKAGEHKFSTVSDTSSNILNELSSDQRDILSAAGEILSLAQNVFASRALVDIPIDIADVRYARNLVDNQPAAKLLIGDDPDVLDRSEDTLALFSALYRAHGLPELSNTTRSIIGVRLILKQEATYERQAKKDFLTSLEQTMTGGAGSLLFCEKESNKLSHVEIVKVTEELPVESSEARDVPSKVIENVSPSPSPILSELQKLLLKPVPEPRFQLNKAHEGTDLRSDSEELSLTCQIRVLVLQTHIRLLRDEKANELMGQILKRNSEDPNKVISPEEIAFALEKEINLRRALIDLLQREPLILEGRPASESRSALAQFSKEIAGDFESLFKWNDFERLGKLIIPDVETSALRYEWEHGATIVAAKNLSLAHGFALSRGGLSKNFNDRLSAAQDGLYRAICGFEPERGLKLSTSAYRWMRNNCQREREQMTANGKVSVGHTVSADSSVTLVEKEARSREPSPDIGATQLEMIERIQSLLHTLSERARFVIERRFGLNGQPEMTLGEVGDLLGVTGERVRQIQVAAIRRLKRQISVVQVTAAELSIHPSTTNNDELEDTNTQVEDSVSLPASDLEPEVTKPILRLVQGANHPELGPTQKAYAKLVQLAAGGAEAVPIRSYAGLARELSVPVTAVKEALELLDEGQREKINTLRQSGTQADNTWSLRLGRPGPVTQQAVLVFEKGSLLQKEEFLTLHRDKLLSELTQSHIIPAARTGYYKRGMGGVKGVFEDNQSEVLAVAMARANRAFDSYDQKRGLSFLGYIVNTVERSLGDYQRSLDPFGRLTRQALNRMEEAQSALISEFGFEAVLSGRLDAELEHRAQLTKGLPELRREVSFENPKSIYVENDYGFETRSAVAASRTQDPVADLEDKELAVTFFQALRNLSVSPKACRVVWLYDVGGLTMREAGDVLGVTESRACQLRKEALEKLKGLANPLAIVESLKSISEMPDSLEESYGLPASLQQIIHAHERVQRRAHDSNGAEDLLIRAGKLSAFLYSISFLVSDHKPSSVAILGASTGFGGRLLGHISNARMADSSDRGIYDAVVVENPPLDIADGKHMKFRNGLYDINSMLVKPGLIILAHDLSLAPVASMKDFLFHVDAWRIQQRYDLRIVSDSEPIEDSRYAAVALMAKSG